MLEIYIDGVLLDDDYYQSLKQDWVMFDNVFKLGTTMARQFILTIPKSQFISTMNNFLIKLDGVDYAHLQLDTFKIIEGGVGTVELTLVDKMVNANVPYDASSITPCTVGDILTDIALKIGVELGTLNFTNDDIVVDYWDNTVTAREYLSYIAELNGGFARIERDGKLYLRNFYEVTPHVVDPEVCEEIKIGQVHEIERVVFDNGIIKFETSNDTSLETLYLNPNNVYINDEIGFNNIVIKTLGFKYTNLETGRTQIYPEVLVGDVLSLTLNEIEVISIAQYKSLEFFGQWTGGYALVLESSKQNETNIKGINSIVKNLSSIMDRLNNMITLVVERSELNESDIASLKISEEEIIASVTAVRTDLDGTITEKTNTLTQSIDGWELLFDTLEQNHDALDVLSKDKFAQLIRYIRFNDGNIELGDVGTDEVPESEFKLLIESTMMSFWRSGQKVAWFSNNQLVVLDGWFTNSLRVGNFAYRPRVNGSLSFGKVV